MRAWSLIPVFFVSIWANTFQYSTDVMLLFDSNVGQNSYEQSDTYVIPKISTSYKFDKIALILFADMVYDSYIIERDFDDNSPFLSTGISYKFGSKSVQFRIQPLYELYMANRSYSIENPKKQYSLRPALQSFNLENSLILRKKRHLFELPILLSYYDYGTSVVDSTNYRSSKEGFYILVSPAYEHIWKAKKQSFKLKEIQIKVDYKQAFLDENEESYNYWRVSGKAKMKLFYPFFSCKVTYGIKYYQGSETHPHTGHTIWGKNRYIKCDTKLIAPITKSLSAMLGYEINNKESNRLGNSYNQSVLSLGIHWEQSFSNEIN